MTFSGEKGKKWKGKKGKKTSFSALNIYNTCLFVNYTLMKLKKELKEKACEWLNKWYYHGTFILTSYWNMQQLAWTHFHRDKLFTKGYISYDSVCETSLKWQNYRNWEQLSCFPLVKCGVGWMECKCCKRATRWSFGDGMPCILDILAVMLYYSFAWGLPLEETL